MISELQKREELRRFAKLVEIPEAKDIYRFLSIIVDSTDVSLDLNWFRKKITKADLVGKEFKWGYSSSGIAR